MKLGLLGKQESGGGSPSLLLFLGLICFLPLPDGGPGPGKAPWPGDFGTTAKESGGSGAPEERPRENGDALSREVSLGSLPGPSAQPHKGEWSIPSCHFPWVSSLMLHSTL